MTNRIKLGIAVALVVLAVPAGLWLRVERPWETSAETAYRLCGECGLEVDEIDRLIDHMSHSVLDRDGLLELFRETFDNPADAQLCEGFAAAILDEAARRDEQERLLVGR